MTSRKFSLVFFLLLNLLNEASGQSLCEDIVCYGQSMCKEGEFTCDASGKKCKLPYCVDKDISDYENDVIEASTIEGITHSQAYIDSTEQSVKCQGMTCWGSNTCVILEANRLNMAEKFLPLCDDSPIPEMLRLRILE